ncbi:HIG1 domain family member 2A, mitochondrial-like [Tubulanus polymorphus]|uniref:HIG1 domain family member 2A, mitochondrial-like n=1 Tax=Tubulanus polymorphus TaxID=672921 RepID=UPI003DA3C382
MSNIGPPPEDFAYLAPPKSSIDDVPRYYNETFYSKFKRKADENPFVPIGMGLTTLALTYGLWQLKTGDTKMSQLMMRSRIVAQGFTVFAILGGVLYGAGSSKKKSS